MAKYDDAPVNKAKSNQEAVQDDHNVIDWYQWGRWYIFSNKNESWLDQLGLSDEEKNAVIVKLVE